MIATVPTWLPASRRYTAHGPVVLHAKPRGRYVLSTKATSRRRTHLAHDLRSVWVKGRLERLSALTVCGRSLLSATVLVEVPDDFALCDVCMLTAELGPDGLKPAAIRAHLQKLSTAMTVLARAVSAA